MQAEAHQEAAVIIQERHQVDAAVLPLEHEREQVRLPQLIGLGPLEAALLRAMRAGRFLHPLVARFVQHAGHRRRTGGQCGTADEHVADPLATPFRMLLFEHQDRALGDFRHATAGATPRG